jgi:uncharacterized protein (TIGR02145 family)
MKNMITRMAVLKGMALFCAMYFISGTILAQDKGIYADKRDGQVYAFSKIGKQVWMLENLKFATPEGSWIAGNDTVNQAIYGRQYDYANAMKACPKGWHLPSAAEWDALVKALGGEELAAEGLKAMDTVALRLKSAKAGTLSALLAGVRHGDGTVTGIGIWGGFWSSTVTTEGATNYLFARGSKSVGKSTNDKASGFSVRCIRGK